MIDKLFLILRNVDRDNVIEFFEERAAVREFEAGYPRDEAERLAFQDTIDYFAVANHILETTNNI